MQREENEIIEDLDKVLGKRDELYPLRDERNTNEMHELLDQLLPLIDTSHDNYETPDNEHVILSEKFKDNSIFLCGSMKSGTTLLLGLLDGHNELNVMPGDSYLINKFSHPLPKRKYSWNDWRENWLKRMINPTGQKPFWIFGSDLSCYSEYLHYMDYWIEQLPAEERRPILSAVLSYFCANPNRPRAPGWWVEKTPGNEFKTKAILKHFPHAKLIHIVRDPRENFASLKRLYSSRGWSWDYIGMVRLLAQSMRAAYINQKRLGESRYLIINYEELTHNTREVMERVTDFLDISWDDTLLRPSINSQPAQANTMYKDRQITGLVRKSEKSKWAKELSRDEVLTISSIRSEARKFAYDWEITWLNYLEMLKYRMRLKLWKK